VPSAPLSVDALAAALRDPEWCEAPVTDAISPLTPVELTDRLDTPVPVATPRLFVGVGTGGEADSAVDLVVSADDELDRVASACAANPTAVIVLAQLLRATESLDIASALVAESVAYSTLLGGAEFAVWRSTHRASPTRRSSAPVQIADDGERITITLNRPEVHNAYDASTRDGLVDSLRAASALESARTVVLVGNGPSFCSGGDLGEFGTTDDPAIAHLIRSSRSPGLILHRLGSRAVVRVHGACIGAGVEIPAFCSRIEARGDATFRLPEIAMGLIPGAGGTASIPRRIGRQRMALLAISGREIDAATALRWGLVDAVCDE
jgi:hypothetical protein